VRVTLAVSVVPTGGSTALGTVTVTGGSGCAAAVAAGQCDVTFASTGAKTLSASYGGDASFNGSASADEGHTVNKASTSTAVSSDLADPTVVGQAVTVKVTG